MTSYPTPWEKAGKTLTAIRQLGRIRNCLRLNLQICLFNGITEPRHATLTSHPRRTHIAPAQTIYRFRFRVSSRPIAPKGCQGRVFGRGRQVLRAAISHDGMPILPCQKLANSRTLARNSDGIGSTKVHRTYLPHKRTGDPVSVLKSRETSHACWVGD